MTKHNLYHIKRRFEHQTGVHLITRVVSSEDTVPHKRRYSAVLIAAIVVIFITLSAFTVSTFSTIAGDSLTITASYYGSGIVWLDVTNQSEKELKLEPKIELYYYSTQTLVYATDEKPYITNLTIPANSTEKVRLDLRRTYDIEALENTKNDFYYLQITNDRFLLGQKWSCMVSFTVSDYVTPYYELSDESCLNGVLPSLKAYYQNFTPDIFARWPDAFNYLELVQAELSKVEGNLVRACDTPIYFDEYDWMGSIHWSSFDGYNKILGVDDSEYYNQIAVDVPSVQDDGRYSGGGWLLPLFYLYEYEKSQIQSPQDYAFIRGNLLTFQELEPYKVYDDGEYVIYEMHHLFYTDLQAYVKDMLLQRDDVYINDQIWTRIENFYNHFSNKEVMGAAFYNVHNPGIHADDEYLTMPDVIELAKKGESLSYEDIRQYRGGVHGLTLYENDTGGDFTIDGSYELFYGLHLDGTLRGWYLIHKPSGESIDIRYENVEAFIKEHGDPLPRCACENKEGYHGWTVTLQWLLEQGNNIMISDLGQSCQYSLDEDTELEKSIDIYPLYDTEAFYLKDCWSEENNRWMLWLVHAETGDRCDVETEDTTAFVESHS